MEGGPADDFFCCCCKKQHEKDLQMQTLGYRGRITEKANAPLLAGRAGWTVTLVGERQDRLTLSKWLSNRIHKRPLSRYTGGTHLRTNAAFLQRISYSPPACARRIFNPAWPLWAARSDTTKSELIRVHWRMLIWWHFWSLAPGPRLWLLSLQTWVPRAEERRLGEHFASIVL